MEQVVIQSQDPAADAAAEKAANEAALAAHAKGTTIGGGGNQVAPTETPVPEGIPEKFNGDVSALAKAYAELEKKLSSGGTADTEGTEADPLEKEGTPSNDGGDPKTPQDLTLDNLKTGDDPEGDAAEKVVTDAGLDFEALNEEFAKNGELSEGTYEALKAKGISEDVTNQYIAGRQAVAQLATQDILSVVGGLEAYQTMGTWAAENYSEGEQQAFDAALNSGNVEQAKLAMSGLQARYTASEGRGDPQVHIKGGSQGATTGTGYRSKQEQLADMRDPRYQNDPAFQRDVATKTAAYVKARNEGRI